MDTFILKNMTKRHLILVSLLGLCGLLWPQQSWATYVDEYYNYSVSLNGSNSIRLQVPVYDQDGADCWVTDGNLKMTYDGKTVTVFHWSRNGDTDSDSKDIFIHFKTEADGIFDVTQGNSSNHFSLDKSMGDVQRLVYRNNDGKTYTIYAVWRLPYDMLGKKLKFTWDVQRDGNSRSKEKVSNLSDVEISVPKAADVIFPQLTEAAMSYSEQGKLEVPWFIASTSLTAARYEYTDDKGNLVKQTLPTNMNNGTIYLDATVPHNNFRVVVSYKDRDGYMVENIPSVTQNLKVVHAPVAFTATPTGDAKGSVELTWSIEYPASDDMIGIDFFEVQRSLTGQEADFTAIGTVAYSQDQRAYSFTDNTLVEDISAAHLDKGTLKNLTYRVRRSSTQTWGWDGNTVAATARCVVDRLHLQRIGLYKAQWEDERAYTARVSWKYIDEYNAVWDERAQLMLRVILANRNGAPVDTVEYALTRAEREAKYKIINLARPCINYKVEMYVDRGTSPIPLLEETEPYFFPIYTTADWDAFCMKVQDAGNRRDVNARLYADISVSRTVGSLDNPFRGIFDGNGHSITFSYSSASLYTALFSIVTNATFKNLHVKGTVSSENMYCGGLIGRIQATDGVLIENCTSSVVLKLNRNGDSSSGGFVGIANEGKSLTLRNCIFNGSFEGVNSSYNGGFVGYAEKLDVNIENCVFDPAKLDTSTEGCHTWVRIPDNKRLHVKNCFATQEYGENSGAQFVIHDAAGWNEFVQRVKAAAGNTTVNAVLAADISVTTHTPADVAFKGSFDGNGHTLTVNIGDGSMASTAPFATVGDVSIHDLHVVGTVKGKRHSSGLIGKFTGEGGIRLDRVWVSANVTTDDGYMGGMIGHGHEAVLELTDCRFDGTLTHTGHGAEQYVGAIFGWGHTTNMSLHRVYENGTYTGFAHVGFSYWYRDEKAYAWGDNANSTLCVSAHDWPEVVSDYRSVTDQNAVVSLMNAEADNAWKLADGKAVPVMQAEGLEDRSAAASMLIALGGRWKKVDDYRVTVSVPSLVESNDKTEGHYLPNFYHESTGKIDPTLVVTTRQSSVLLTWETDGNPIDFFTVLRRVKGTASWDTIKSGIDQLSYEDTTVSPLLDYEYKVRATNDCEGQHFSETDVKAGACMHSGRLEGYVRFSDGTGAAGVEVLIEADDATDRSKPGATKTVTTSETGYFEADELPYLDRNSITYNVTPVATSIKLAVESYAVTFDAKSNNEMVHEFTVTNGLQFNAYVMYEGTSIPVKGVRFKVDGTEVHRPVVQEQAGTSKKDEKNYVETDFEGRAQFYVLGGKTSVIQAVMDGHTFVAGGYYKGADGVTLTDKVAQANFYDSTLVKLTGRVVGGLDQGELPLDHNLSRNNLGDNLTMVLTLEGDNNSWLVFDNVNPQLSRRTVTFDHPAGGGHKTTVDVQRKRMVVNPDPVTGEYVLMLPPVRWKVQQVYCDGYPTLFQDGQVSEVIDLTGSLKEETATYKGTYIDVDNRQVYQPAEKYNYRYNRIYRAPVEITYKQVGYDKFSYFGDKSYRAQSIGGDPVDVPLAMAAADSVRYTFGYPVFSLERSYPIQISVVERYPWNGEKGSKREDVVRVSGGKVTVHNGMQNGLSQQEVQLDSIGQGIFQLRAEATTRLLTGDDALRTVTMTLEQDGTTYEAKPLKGYVLNMFATSGAKDVICSDMPLLIDILRDPPGNGSSATLSKGSKLKLSYTVDMKFKAGLSLSWSTGNSLDNYSGVVLGQYSYGLVNQGKSENLLNFDVIFSGSGKKGYSYTMNVGEDISTSSSNSMVGADADLYIGVEQNMVVTPMSTIRAIPDSSYQHIIGRLGGKLPTGKSANYGTLVNIAQGTDTEGNIYHLVRDESLAYGPQVKSQFVHSQRYIVSELLPKLANEIWSMIYVGTEAEAQARAQATGKPVYLSLVPTGDKDFGVKYKQIMPKGDGKFPDELAEKYAIFKAWIDMIGQNEREKLGAYDLVANYDVDGGSKVVHSETFENEYSVSEHILYPYETADYFGSDGVNAADVLVKAGAVMWSQPIVATVFSALAKKMSGNVSATGNQEGKMPEGSLELRFAGTLIKFGLKPVMEYSATDTYGTTHNYTRKESFTMAMDNKSHLNVDVYRVKTLTNDTTMSANNFEVFYNANFNEWNDAITRHINEGIDFRDAIYPRSFVYRTRGGATSNPWEDERRTQVYQMGSLLDEPTKRISNPKITLDRQSISGVPVGAPARFKLYLTNDSEYPEAISGALLQNTLMVDETTNPHGARIYVDSSPLNGTGQMFLLKPGEVVEKTLEVYAGEEFDYEGLTLRLASTSDIARSYDQVKFDVHFLREAGMVNISSPADKWVMNTDASYDPNRGWYLPIVIDGFNKYQKNFDHIEFQYKPSQRGEDYWTNLCSFYEDKTLMAQASGVRELIPENGTIKTNFYGEGTVTEKGYDLRAVLYCRDGNSFLTSTSKVLSGVKDTRRPQLFGTPEPVDGILSMGKNIVFNFSEDIEYNYLNHNTNFEVKGEVNNQAVTETVSLLFTGEASVESEARRNFSDKDVTIDMMIRPEDTGKDMPLFSHGQNGSKLQLWLKSDRKLMAIVGEHTYTSDKPVADGGFQQVAMVLSQPVDDVSPHMISFYNGGLQIGQFAMTEGYGGNGPLIFGRTNETNRHRSSYYQGRMMEARVWYRAMTGSLIGTTYGGKRLTGREPGLVDYYPMNEGLGDYAIDRTQGANAQLIGAAWVMPKGYSLHVDWDDRGLPLNQNALNRTREQDYTLMFWFRTDSEGRGVLLSNGAGQKTDIGAENQFCLAFEAEKLTYRSNGMAVIVPGDWSDNKWHHYAMTVSRSNGVANIYVDCSLRSTFPTDSLGGISGGYPLIGAARYDTMRDGQLATIDTRNWLRGNIDELCFFAQALPLSLISNYSTRSPQGDEAGLLTYLAFDRQERQKDNDIVLMPYAYSKKVYLDDKGDVRYQTDPVTQEATTTPIRDFSFDSSLSEADVLRHIEGTTAAPVIPYEELHNLSFSFVGKGNQVLVNIDEPAARVNDRRIFVTVRDVEDKNGNAMASPATMAFYVSNSSLNWQTNRLQEKAFYGNDCVLSLTIVNNSAQSHAFSIENCPKWLALDTYYDIVGANDSKSISAVVNKNLNVGTYDEIIYLVDEDGVTEPLYLNLTVEAFSPELTWGVPGDMLQYSMNIVGEVYLNDEIDIDTRDFVGVFDSQNQCRGKARIDYSPLTGQSSVYLTVYDNQATGRKLYFKLWQYTTGRELLLTPSEPITFQNSAVMGVDNPVIFTGGSQYVQTFELQPGWNWVSFNVASNELFNLNNLLDNLPWKEGDVLTDMSSDLTLLYHDGHWLSSGERTTVRLSPRKAYAIKVKDYVEFPVAGNIIRQADQRTITVDEGWNGIGYTPMLNLSIETALADYYDKASVGDVVKSHTEFAYFSKVAGVKRWQGSLQYMKPGEGYLLLRKDSTEASFKYPFLAPNSTFIDEWAYATTRRAAPHAAQRHTMSLSAAVSGVELQQGDRLLAFADGLQCGSTLIAMAPDGQTEDQAVSYLSIEGSDPKPIWFAIERDGEIVASTPELMTFRADDVVGTPDQPATISFVRQDAADAHWHTVSGVQLPGKPTRKGLYIFNGKKVVVK